MENLERDPQLADLTAELAWLRRMARALVRDDDAEDVAHDAWLAGDARAPADADARRPWFGRVVTNLVRMRARARGRREAREAAIADLAQEARRPDELVERVELQHLVAGEVLRLAEPYRATILMHYMEELSCAEIARKLAIPEGTVRRRLKVALDQLRARIADRERRAGGIAILGPLAFGGSRPPAAIGALAMKKLLVALVVLLVLLVGAALWRSRAPAEPASAPAVGSSSVGAAAGSAKGVGSDVAASADAAIPRWLVQPGAPARRIAGRVTSRGAPVAGASVELASIASEAGLAASPRVTTNTAGEFDFGAEPALEWSVRASAPGRAPAMLELDLRDPTGHPAPDHLELALGDCTSAMYGTVRDASGGTIANARVTLVPANAPRRVHGGPGVTTDAKGAYELCAETRWPGWVALEAAADGYASVVIRTIVPGRMKLDIALVPEAVISGRVVRDDTGAPVPEAYVYIPERRGRTEATPVRGAFTDASGRFRLERVTAGRHLVYARAAELVASEGMPVTVGVGQTSPELELRLAAGSTVRGVVRDGTTAVAGARVVAADAFGPRASAVSQGDGSFVLVGVPRGEVRFTAFPYEVDKPLTFHVAEPEHAGVVLEVESRGTILGHVVRGRAPAPGATIDIHGPNDGELSEVRADASGRFEVHGLRAGPWTLFASDDRVGAFGRAPETVHVQRGETSELTIDLAYAASVAGRVVDQSGAPVPGVTVTFENTRSDDAGFAATADDGAFRAAMMTGGGDYRVTVRPSAENPAQFQPAAGGEFPTIAIADGSTAVTGVVLAIQLDKLAISGTVVDSDGAPVADARVIASLADRGQPAEVRAGVQQAASTSDVDGRFSIDGLPSGIYALRGRATTGVEATLPSVPAGKSGVTLVVPSPGSLDVALANFKATPQVTALRKDLINLELPTYATAQGSGFSFKTLSPGSYLVAARSASEVATQTVEVAAGRTTRITLTGGGTGTISGHVRVFKTGAPVEGMTCRAAARQGIQIVPAATADAVRSAADGAFSLAAAPGGEIAVSCDGLWRNFSTGVRAVTLQPGQRLDVDVPVVALTEEPGITLASLGAGFDPAVLVSRLVGLQPRGPAASAGFAEGDVIVAVDGAGVTELSPNGVWSLIVNRPPGSRVALRALRGGKTINGEVVLANAR